jgi:capsid protein
VLQTWLVEHFVERVFSAWLEMSLTTGSVNLPPRKFAKFNAPVWRPRGWTWIDPLKEVKAHKEANKTWLKSLQMSLGEQGIDLEDVLEDQKIAKELAAKYDVELPEE